MSEAALETFGLAQFSWAFRLDDVWSDLIHDVEDLHPNLRSQFAERVGRLLREENRESPLGWVLIGEGGSGKTHLLNAFRRFSVERGAYFVLLDLTDVRTFWESVLQGYLDSLQQEATNGVPQYQLVLERLVRLKLGENEWEPRFARLQNDAEANDAADQLVRDLWKRDRKIQPSQQDVIRCLAYLNSGSFQLYNLAVTCLQGQELDKETREEHKFQPSAESPVDIAGSISRVMAHTAPTVLALDQLDATVMQLATGVNIQPSTDEATAEALLLEIGRGLLALRDKLQRTWTILSCLEQTWSQLRGSQLKTATDRYEDFPRVLNRMGDEAAIGSLISLRMGEAAKKTGFSLPYSTWPIHAEAIAKMVGETPRDILKICERHRRECLERCRVEELRDFEPPAIAAVTVAEAELKRLDELYERLQGEVDLTEVLAEEAEDNYFAPLLDTAAKLAIEENFATLPRGIDVQLDATLPSGRIRPLHSRLRVIFESEGEREQHYCVRVLQKTNHRAYQARLKAAIVAAGIDAKLPFRQLRILRTTPIPTGYFTDRLNLKFKKLGGTFVCPEQDELRKLVALRMLQLRGYDFFNDWVLSRHPLSEIGFVRAALPCLQLWGERRFDELKIGDYSPAISSGGEETSCAEDAPDTDQISLGRLISGQELRQHVTLPPEAFSHHAIILAGAKSGRSALLKRLAEEAVLRGAPVVFVDFDSRAALDEPWPEPPESWEMEDIRKAGKFHQIAKVQTWTPGLSGGRELPLDDAGAIDFAKILGPVSADDGASVSVVNGKGLASKDERQTLIRGLLASAHRWLENAAPRPNLRGLLVIDEADTCISSKRCAERFVELANSARNKNFGLLISLQDPSTATPPILKACEAHIFGRAHSPEAIGVVKKHFRKSGGDEAELNRLLRGEFFVRHPKLARGKPLKIYSPICLSRHPKEPLSGEEILAKLSAGEAETSSSSSSP